MMTKGELTQHLFQEILKAYNQTGTTWVRLPVRDVTEILSALSANVLAQVEDPNDRRDLMQSFLPRMENMINSVRQRSYTRQAWRGPAGLILPS